MKLQATKEIESSVGKSLQAERSADRYEGSSMHNPVSGIAEVDK